MLVSFNLLDQNIFCMARPKYVVISLEALWGLAIAIVPKAKNFLSKCKFDNSVMIVYDSLYVLISISRNKPISQ